MPEHARIAPSLLPLIRACHAALQMQEAVPPLPETDEEAEGTAAHWVARRHAAGYGHELPVGAMFPSGGRMWKVDADMHAGARLYERAVGGYHPELHLEERVAIPHVHEECWGTPDAWRYFQDARIAYAECPEGVPFEAFTAGLVKLVRVPDYKYGHRYHEVFEHPQLSAYVSGVLSLLGLLDVDPLLYIELMLVQPRSYHRDGPVRVWRFQALALRNIIIELNDAAHRALIPLNDPMFAPLARTGSHCLDCKARHVCRTFQMQTQRLVDFAHTAERAELPPMALGQELAILEDAMQRLEARHEGLSAQAEALIRAGHAVPFYHMEAGRSVLTYLDDVNADELVGLGELINIDLRKKLERKDLVVTPTQAIQLGVDEGVMKQYAHRPAGKQKLTRDNSLTARKVFSK